MDLRITNKQIMYRLLMAGRFGNYVRAWNSLEEIAAAGYSGHVSIRSNQISNPVRLYHVPFADLPAAIAALPDNQSRHGLRFSESPPDHLRTIQGEYDGYSLTFSFAPLPMRLAFAQECHHATGLTSRILLRRYLTAGDFDWLDSLLEDFPGSTVEFSAFSAPVGTTPGSQCIFWEVRHY